ncbi:unnamed protein product, partial [Darwinula stevensoni]
GEDAEIEQIPWQISFQTLSGFHFCGGSIMDSTHVITAAHCCDGEGPGSANIRAGSNRNDRGGVLVNVADVLQHPSFDWNDLSNDICLLTLDEPLPLDDVTMKAVALPEQDQDYEGGVDVSVSGWGTLSPGGSTPDILQVVDVYTYTDDACNEAYGGDVTPDMICAGVDEGGKDSCQGDSGGPLFLKGGDEHLVGIVSWGYSCAEPDFPGVYAQTSTHIDWLAENSK